MLNRAFDKNGATESTMKKTNVNDERGFVKKKVYSYLLFLPHLTNEHSHHLIIIVIHAFNGPSHYFGTHDIPWKNRICHSLIYENIFSNIKIIFNCYIHFFFLWALLLTGWCKDLYTMTFWYICHSMEHCLYYYYYFYLEFLLLLSSFI